MQQEHSFRMTQRPKRKTKIQQLTFLVMGLLICNITPAVAQTKDDDTDKSSTIIQQRQFDPKDIDVTRKPNLDPKIDLGRKEKFIEGNSSQQPGAEKLETPSSKISMGKIKTIKPTERDLTKIGGMSATKNIKIYTPKERFQGDVKGLQRPGVRVDGGKGDQKSDPDMSIGQHGVIDFLIDGSRIEVVGVHSVPGPVQKYRYLRGSIVWRALIENKTVAVGSMADPRQQHSLIRGKHDTSEPAPSLAEKAYFSIPLTDDFLSRKNVERINIEFFILDPTVPVNTELNIKSFDEAIKGNAEIINRVPGQALHKALYQNPDLRQN